MLVPSPGDVPDPGMESAFPALAGGFLTTKPPGKPLKKREREIVLFFPT